MPTIKEIYTNPIDTIKLNRNTIISIKFGARQGYELSLYLLNIVLDILVRQIKQLKDIGVK